MFILIILFLLLKYQLGKIDLATFIFSIIKLLNTDTQAEDRAHEQKRAREAKEARERIEREAQEEREVTERARRE
jgi:hypothetical protein